MSTVRRRRLASDLKALREAAGLTPEEVADALDTSDRTIRRAEHPKGSLPKEHILRGMLNLYGADSKTAAALTQTRLEAKQNQRGLWVRYREVIDLVYVGYEEEAVAIRSWQNVFVPGLLQTDEYAAAIVEGIHPGDPKNPQRIDARALRRSRFTRRAPALHAIIDESVLHRTVGSQDVMWGQISHLRSVSRRTNITLQIVPLSAGVHPGMAGCIVLFDFDDTPTAAYLETRGGDLYPEDAPTLAGLNIDWGHILRVALTSEESARLLADLLEG